MVPIQLETKSLRVEGERVFGFFYKENASSMEVSHCLWTRPKLLLVTRWPTFALPTAARAIRLQEMRQRVDVTQLAVLDAEEVRIGRSTAAVRGACSERAERHHGSNR